MSIDTRTTQHPQPGSPQDSLDTRSSPSTACPAAAEVVGRFLAHLRRRDLDALAALLRADVEVVLAGTANPAPVVARGPDAARDWAQVVLRSFGGSGLVDTEVHPSTDGRTVFVEFGPDSPDGDCWRGQPAVRLLRFTTGGGAIIGICEYTDAGPANLVDAGARSPGAPVAGGGSNGTSGAADWPSLGGERSGDRRPGSR